MKDIAYYAGFLTPEQQEEINKATIGQIVDLLSDISSNLYFKLCNLDKTGCSHEDSLSNHWQLESDRDKIGLIRGLCDRIELRLMEAAKQMKNFVITIPIDEHLEACVYEIGYLLYCRDTSVCKALIANDPDALFQIFDGMENPDLGIEYGFTLEITADKPVRKKSLISPNTPLNSHSKKP